MRVVSALVVVAGLLTAVPSALATITITGPSPSAYWVQNTSNQITWEFTHGDPNPISITVTNPNSTSLNGPFAIAENVDLSNKTFTVTRVTLKVASGYVVNFVNGSDITQVYAQSGTFDVKPPGTTTVTQATPSATSPSGSGNGNGSGNGTSPSGSSNSSATASGASASASNKSNASLRSIDGSLMTLAPMLGMSALMSVLGALATL